ncbi:hypothetical protein HDU86_002240 [Geranomyces michiganensis]|nr:hypothetical protein HDU86_002240 [Geranomyces michiganensis]
MDSTTPDVLFVAEGVRFEVHSAALSKHDPPLALPPPPAASLGSSPYTIILPDVFSAAAVRCFLSYLHTSQYHSPTPPPPPEPTAAAAALLQNPLLPPQTTQSQAPPPTPTPQTSQRPPKEKSILYSVSLPRIPETTPSLLVQVYRLAVEFSVPGLKAAVARDMTMRLNERNYREFAECAARLDCQPVALMVETFVGKNTTRAAGGAGDEGNNGASGTRKVKRLASRLAAPNAD